MCPSTRENTESYVSFRVQQLERAVYQLRVAHDAPDTT